MTIWKLHQPISPEDQKRFPDVNPLFVQLMKNRGLDDREEIRTFLRADFATLHTAWDLPDIEKGVAAIVAAIEKKHTILVHGDYDVDGILGTTIMVKTLTQLGATVEHFLPDRVKDGYGVTSSSLAIIKERGAKLLVTVDCGTRDVDRIAALEKEGIPVVVIDHHNIPETIAPATALINPKRTGHKYPFDQMCATAVAYRVSSCLFERMRGDARLADQFLDLAAISSIADVVPLISENRIIVREGLKRFATISRQGLIAMLEGAGKHIESVDPFSIGFIIAPRINAAGRIASPEAAYKLIAEDDPATAQKLAAELNELNTKRQQISNSAFEEISALHQKHMPIVFHSSRDWPSGVAGLVAGKLAERFGKPAFVLEEREDRAVGSARCSATFDVTGMLDVVQDLLVVYGGHRQAAGFTVHKENIDIFRIRLEEQVQKQMQGRIAEREIVIDAEIDLTAVDNALWNFIKRMEPFGNSNPEPRFLARDLTLHSARAVGATKTHLKLQVQDAAGTQFNGIGFNIAALANDLPLGSKVDVVFALQENQWQGVRTIEMQVLDMAASAKNSVQTFIQEPQHV